MRALTPLAAQSLLRVDTEYEIATVRKVTPDGGRGFSIERTDGWGIFVDNQQGLPLPSPGDEVVMWGRGIGYPVRGIAFGLPRAGDGLRLFRYKTADDYEAERRAGIEREKRERRAKWDAGRADFDARIDLLPGPLATRMRRFLRDGGDEWGAELGEYELMCCEDAAKIAQAHTNADDVIAFRKLSHDEQTARVPGLDDGHSGNSFGHAVRLAYWMHRNEGNAVREHAGMCALVGCREAHCWATTGEAP